MTLQHEPPARVLVANRGEIAVRIMSTLKRLGLGVVAVYSDADRHAPHVMLADSAVRIGPAPVAESYLVSEAIIDAALVSGASWVHPGYGLLSENAEFALACEQAGLVFVGPTPEQIAACADKDAARRMAASVGVPVLPGSEVLADEAEAIEAGRRIGYPSILKSVAGGGGIGMAVCRDVDELVAAFATVRSLAAGQFGDARVLLERLVERARHVEVQIVGDGRGNVVSLGDRDCSLQRRNQKVIEECPAPRIPADVRAELHAAAIRLGEHLSYRNVGTVEFLLDDDTGRFAFLEVNTRLQVEHPVTEACFDIDLVELMLRIAGGDAELPVVPLIPSSSAIEARIYAEDPDDAHRPSTGLITSVHWPVGVRVDSWIDAGTEVGPWYDPLIAKVIAHGTDRSDAIARLDDALAATRIGGIATNLDQLRGALALGDFVAGTATTATLTTAMISSPSVSVVDPGTFTSVQELPGRLGYWSVGVPPSGPMDDRSFRLANELVGNPPEAPAFEITARGPTLRFRCDASVAVAGAEVEVTVDGVIAPTWSTLLVPAGSELRVGTVEGPGVRAYLAIAGGVDVPEHLGSGATFVLGGFGGHQGRCLRAGDVVRLAAPAVVDEQQVAPADRQLITHDWSLDVLVGPHGAPEFLTVEGAAELLDAPWTVHFNSDRTGIRLIGPSPRWARADGGEAGLHPSNIHDTPYTVGAVDLTGDMPIILGPDGPSLGGFVCPLTVVSTDRWKLGQLRAGDRVRFRAVEPPAAGHSGTPARPASSASAVLARSTGGDGHAELVFRRSGDHHVLVEVGPNVLDLALRARVHALMTELQREPFDGMHELTPGIRSLQIRFDPTAASPTEIVDRVIQVDDALGPDDDIVVPSRVVHLPLSWDDPAAREAVARYARSVRSDAPWCPSNIEFIRRINGLESIDDVQRVVLDAEYLVLGLGDVYLGAPVATPIDPRHRLVTTKYNPARTWTPENAVGIGGAYLCVYGMEGPGGYQLVGRTVQMWNRWNVTELFEPGRPWLLRFFDRLKFHLVSAEELADMRDALPHGRFGLRVEQGEFRLSEHRRRLNEMAGPIASFREQQRLAFAQERERWARSGIDLGGGASFDSQVELDSFPADLATLTTPVHGIVVGVLIEPGVRVEAGDTVAVMESMKMETPIQATVSGEVAEVLVKVGSEVTAGGVIGLVRP